MENAFQTRLKLMYDSVQSYITTAQSVLLERSDAEYISKLRMVESKLKGATERLASEVCNYSKTVKKPDNEKISQYTLGQIHAEDLISEINVTIKQNNQDNPTVLASNKNINISNKLPKMELAKFDGDVLKWYQFWDQFSSNVDSRNISDVDKLLYLQSVLVDDAKQAIEGLDTTNKNYKIAVNTLKERFGKPGTIIDAHYVALYRTKTAQSNQIKDCRHVLNEIERHLRVLSSLGEDVNHNHLRVMIMEKFPEDLIYEVKMKMADEEETIDNIRKYLEYIISARETSNRLKRKSVNMDNMDKEITDEGQLISENITVGALHVKSEEMRRNKHNRHTHIHRHTNFKGDKPKLFSKQFVKPITRPRKRPLDYTDRNDEPPVKRSNKCVFCTHDHFNDECTIFKTIQERKAQLGNRCYNCFTPGHRAEHCRSKRKCRHCNKFGTHNRALCPTKLLQPVKCIQTNSLHTKTGLNTTLLQTCLVDVTNPKEETKHTQCRVLLDCGSQRSYITESASKKLGLHIIDKVNLSIFTFGTKSPHQIESPTVKFKLTTRTGVTRIIYANVVRHITHDIQTPNCNYQSNMFNNPQFKNLIMADDGSCGGKIDILIGNDYYHSFMNQEKISVTPDLFLVNSDFGWVWSGKLNGSVDSPDKLTILTYFQSNSVFEDKLTKPDLPLKLNEVKRLWDLESIGITDLPTSSRDEEAVKQFNKTIVHKDNRYHVQWPWTELAPSLSNNLGLVWGRLKSLTRRLDNTELKAYDAVMQEQLREGIIELVSNPNASQTHPIHYLPHHCVRHRDKPEKLRIVYDASAKTGDSLSLNECLYRGPLMLEDLTGLLIKFREHPIGIVADVEKAFLQLGLQNQDRDVTRFLWLKDIRRDVCADNILHLRFCRVPFGVISSPFLLNATIRYHLIKSNNNLMKQIAEDIYVDNVVTGAQSISEAKNLYKVSKETFGNLSMNLRDWNSNLKEFVAFIPDKFRANVDDQVKVLGLIWNIHNDYLYLNTKFTINDLNRVQSKRDVLKTIASIYDPCGLAVPVMLPAKLFFQKLWKEKIKWDVKFNKTLTAEWQHIATKFVHLKDICIERYYSRSLDRDKFSNKIEYELHCFTDSSKEAYAAVIYLRSCLDNNSTVSFVIGKSRLVPLKDQNNLQIPKLELLGVLIGCRLINYVVKFVRLNIGKQFLWTDSQVVLNWHQSDKLLPPFVSRRINEIKQNKVLTLRYVPTKLNPSDVGTRADRVDSYKTWLKGPEFLRDDSNHWPVYPTNTNMLPTQNLVAGEGLTNNISLNNSDVQVSDKTEQIVHNSNKSEQEKTKKILDLQAEYFPKEANDNVTDLSRSLGLFKDQDGVIRCHGRFRHTDLTTDQKEPILLPKNSIFTKEIISNLHQKNYHVGVSHTLALLRQKFWIPQGRSIVQSVIRKCPQCIKYGGGPFKLPPMPDLPAERVKLSLPFTFTGLDYFGPLFVDEGRKEKRWVCLFTCLTIRAIHMEVVKDLTAEECLLAIRRFIAVRGFPQLIISDNATQFKLTADTITSDYCIQNNLRWKFIPELAPWFGGFYERLIGLVKHSMKRTLDKHSLSNNQLHTIIKELEAVINTRPLTTVGAELEHVLSPVDFLRAGGPVTTVTSDRDFLECSTVTKTNLIDNWKRGQTILKEFAMMFKNQYLTSLRERNDRHKQSRVVINRTPRRNEIVQIKSDGNRAHWKVGRIAEVIKGSDDQIRVARVKLPSGEILTRSIGHLYPLEIDNDFNSVPISESVNETQSDNPQTSGLEDVEGLRVDEAAVSDGSKHLAQTTSTIRSRPSRLSAIRAKERVREWTSQLLVKLFD